MTFDAHTGFIVLSEISAFFSPSLQRSQFLQHPAFSGARVLVKDEPWCSFGLPLVPMRDTQLSLVFQFKDEHLHSLRLAHVAPRFGSGGKNSTVSLELERKAFHEQWLVHDLGVVPGRHPWGEVSSIFDAESQMSFILVHYSGDETPKTF